ncbi:hypothetical protein K490DRAFT_23415, partial [Saccharata proteae CBS 121410]
MRNFVTTGAVVAALASSAAAMTNGCTDGAEDASGNWYCEPAVTKIKYTGVGGTGSYQKVTNIDSSEACTYETQSYSGSLAPYDEEIAIVFRGPLNLRQFAAYRLDNSSSSSSKAKAKRGRMGAHERRNAHGHAHGHQHFHEHNKEIRDIQDRAEAEKRAEPEVWVTATIDGQVVSWINNYFGPSTATSAAATSAVATSAAAATTTTAAAIAAAEVEANLNVAGISLGVTVDISAGSESSATATSSADSSTSTGTWKRVAYYDSEEKKKSGLTFLTHPSWTNAVAFAGTDGTSQADTSTTFAGELSNADEMFIMTDTPCSEEMETECAYFKDGDEAFHGFGGTTKAFFFEFQMPDSGTHCTVSEMADEYEADNMPAIWTLNAKIMTNQYGCNCQESGCGELDLFEVLNPGNKRMKSTFHGNAGFSGGDSHYVSRPFDYYMSAMVVFHEDQFVIKVMDNNT